MYVIMQLNVSYFPTYLYSKRFKISIAFTQWIILVIQVSTQINTVVDFAQWRCIYQ